MKKKAISAVLLTLMVFNYSGMAFAIQEKTPAKAKTVQAAVNAKTTEFAFVFDGPSDKNAEVLKTFKEVITKSLLPDFKAVFPENLVFTGDWTPEGARKASEQALKSRAMNVISLGYLSSDYLVDRKNTNKFVTTIDEYGLRDFGSAAFFNPLKQSVNDFILFKKLVPTQHKTAILMNNNFYKMRNDWDAVIRQKLDEKDCDLDFAVIPVSSKDLQGSLSKIPSDVDSAYVTPMFNLSLEQRKELYNYINEKKLPSFSSLGKEDVEIGAMLGTSTPDADRKIAEATSFNIHGYLHGNVVKNEQIPFFDDKVIFYNQDTGDMLGYPAPLRLLNNCEIISNKPVTKYDLTYVFNTLQERNLDILQEKYLVDAARRSTVAAYLKYLPTLRIDLGYQSYNNSYARGYNNVPKHAGQFVIGMDQVIYAPDLVTNIIVKHKRLKFEKAQKLLTEQAMGLDIGFLYLDTLMLDNAVKAQDERLHETRENLAIARVREKQGLCGKEEVLQWAGLVSEEEKKLLAMKADLKNIKVKINKILFKDQKENFDFAPLTASDPAFFSSDIHIIDHVRTPEKLAKFTDMFVEEAIKIAPETVKLKAAIAMKKAEMANYAQKFVLPNAQLTMEYGSQFDRYLPYNNIVTAQMKALGAEQPLDRNSGRIFVGAQWKPIEGGQKFAEIARCKAELNQLETYLTEVNTMIEENVREVINRAIAKYFMIEKSYKAMFAEIENYKTVKANYLQGKAPISQLAEAQELYLSAKLDAQNSQYEFFKELMWVQRGLLSINWTKATPEAKKFIERVRETLPDEPDFTL